jgi:hypothetical protein
MAAMTQAAMANPNAWWRPARKGDEIKEGKKPRLESWATAPLVSATH